MLRDQLRFRRRLRGIERAARGGRSTEQALSQLQADIERSIAKQESRQAGVKDVALSFPPDLPVVQRRAEIAKAISEHQVVILCGETGSGKTTQLPKICLEIGRGVMGMIGHTQPRRIAARSVAARIASELQSQLGQVVGYKVRFSDKASPDAFIKIMTDGILLAETQTDRDLLQYDTLIIDEAHERSLNIDFLLGYIKQLLPRRPDLKVIITSATIDPQRFSAHFNNAPVIEVSGRVYPVDVRYRPVQSEEPDEDDPTVLDAIVSAVDEIAAVDEGDILIFLSGEREIRETAEELTKRASSHFAELLPLYARLSTEEQQRVFEPHKGRRIVLATNVAETSLTVPGIKYVIDPGLARISRYSANARVQRLPIELISQASANQRKGRCGRIEAGVCIRLYSQDDFESRGEFTDPEILRSNLASVILQMKALKLGEIERFPFIEPPRPGMVREGYQTLHELGAIDDRNELTQSGRELAKLPVDPRIGRMILAAQNENCLKEMLIIASALATQDPRLRPIDSAKLADISHQQYADERSDFLSYLKLWDALQKGAEELSSNKLRKLCQQRYLSFVRWREWQDVHRQLRDLVTESGMELNAKPATYEDIHRALLTGLLTNVGFKHDGHEYLGVRDRRFHIFPGSGQFQIAPRWVMAAELVETTRLYARTVARVQPEWIEQLAQHLVKRSYTAPYWNAKSAHVEAFERVTLYGLTLVPKRRVHYGKIDPKVAREIFIQQALIEGDYQPPARFDSAYAVNNRALIEDLRSTEAKRRRRDVMVDSQALFEFFDGRIPSHVVNGPLFEKWRRHTERENPRLLFLSPADLMKPGALAADRAEFPDAMNVSGLAFPLRYRHEPGHADDGVTMTVPIEALNQISETQTAWLVPGLLQEKVAALIKTLPKALRVNFVPAPDFAESVLRTLEFGQGDLIDQIAARLAQLTGIEIARQDWSPAAIAEHLLMNFHVVDIEGKVIAAGRSLARMRQQLNETDARQAIAVKSEFDRHFITSWDFGDLPDRVPIQHGAMALHAYPAIVDDQTSVSLRLLDSAQRSAHATRAGVRRLFVLAVRDELAAHIDYLPGLDEMSLHFAPLGSSDQLKAHLIDLCADRVFLGDLQDVRTQVDFERRLRSGWNNLWPVASEISTLIGRILAAHHALDLQLADFDNPFWSEALEDIRTQLTHLMPDGFMLSTPYAWLLQFPRYLQAISVRMRKLANAGLPRDRHATAEVKKQWNRYAARRDHHRQQCIVDPSLDEFRWMIEEFRVSLFAQELGTSIPISSKRIEQQWQKTLM